MRKSILLLLVLASFLTSCLPPASTEAAPSPWWSDAVFYEIFVRSFYDSNGDGIGDFNGIIEKLDYLNDGDPTTTTDLGVTGIWLMPIFPSPSYHGYDVTDYYDVNPQYGTMEDFQRLLEEAHQRGIRVILDLVINHTSDQHPWFRDAKRDKNSKYRDWYIWSETDPGYRGPWNERVWHSSTTGFYYGVFTSNMPDLNFNNRQVTKEIENVMEFWLTDVGVDGFRMDAIKHLIEEGKAQENTHATHEWLQKNFYPTYKRLDPEALAVGELFGNDMNSIGKYVNNKQFDMAFNFQLASSFISSANSRSASYASRALELSEKILDGPQYAPFLTNHDQDRVMSELGGDANKAKVAASLLLTSPGTPFIYYGEEIGMQGRKPDENIRRPMQWSDVENAGFTTGKPWYAPDSNYAQVNVAAQTDDTSSLLSHYRALIQLRNIHPALRTGNYYPVQTGSNRLFASLRVSKEEAVLVLVNLGEEAISNFTLQATETSLAAGEYALTSLFGMPLNMELSVGDKGGFNVKLDEIPAYQTVILELKLK
jgi:glycosidase